MFSPFGKSSDDNQNISNDTKSIDNPVNNNDDTTSINADTPSIEDKFGDTPLNQIVSDPDTFGTRVRLKCSKCNFTFEGYNTPDVCPKCGADKEYFTDV